MASALNTAAKRKKRAFTHWTPQETPPPGTYDPALLAQQQAGQRGRGDFQSDTARDTTRRDDDYIRSQGDVTRGRDEALADVNRDSGRSLADIARSVGYENDDYTRAGLDLKRNYGNLGRAQAGGIFAAGAGGGGALAAAAAARAGNQQRDQQGLDTTHSRSLAGFNDQTSRINEDVATSTGRIGSGADRQLGALALGQQRAGEDSGTALTRAVREQNALGLDTTASEWFQAAATGYSPPPKPAGEGHRNGVYYQRDPKTGRVTLEDGRVVSAAGLRAILARHAGG